MAWYGESKRHARAAKKGRRKKKKGGLGTPMVFAVLGGAGGYIATGNFGFSLLFGTLGLFLGMIAVRI